MIYAKPTLISTSVLAATIILMNSSQAQSQREVSNVGLEEVVVTAERRESNIQTTPLSITALNANELQKRGINNTYDLIGGLPGVAGFEAPGGRGATTLSVRGMSGGSPLHNHTSAAVAIYVDGVYLGKQRSSAFDVADIERIEVLRGPQGTLAGRNSTGGAVNIITKSPSGELGAKLSGTVGKYDQKEFRVNVDTPTLGDASSPFGTLAGSFGYQKRERDGFYRNTTPGDPDFMDINREAYHAAIDWHYSEDTLFAYRYDKGRLGETNNLEHIVGFTALDAAGNVSRIDAMQGVLAAARGWALTPGSDPRIGQRLIPSLEKTIAAYEGVQGQGRPRRGGADHMPRTGTEGSGHSLTFSTDLGTLGFLGDVSFKSITAYRKLYTRIYGDIESFDSRLDANGVGLMNDMLLSTFGQLYGATGGLAFPQVDDLWNGVDEIGAFHAIVGGEDMYRQFSQEVQFTGTTERTEYVVGLYYFDDKSRSTAGPNDPRPTYLAPLSGGGRGSASKGTTTAEAVFGQIKVTPGWMDDRFSITTGLRYTHEKKTTFEWEAEQLTVFGVNPEQTYSNSANFYNLSGGLTLAYDFSDTVNGYLRYSTGFKSGGFNGIGSEFDFDEETIEQVEIGLKSEWLDRRLRINSSLWAYEWKDGQVSQIKITEDNRALPGLGNSGQAKRWGGEVEVQYLPAEGLLLGLSYAYIKGDFESFPPACNSSVPLTCIDSKGQAKRSGSPSNALSVSADYIFLRSAIGNLRGYVEVNWQDEWYENTLWTGTVSGQPVIYPHQVMDSRTLVNARLSLQEIPVGSGTMSVSLWGKNLTNDDYPIYGVNLGALGIIAEQYGDPRTYGLDVTYEF